MKSMIVPTRHLAIEVFDTGPRDGVPLLLLHGWPDDATTWHAVTPRLHASGFRTIAPMHRGCGGTRFRARGRRTGNASVLALDAIALLDALGIERCVAAGHDWGSSAVEALAVGWPDRISRIAMLASPSRLGGLATPSFAQAQRYWYQWFQATRRGRAAIAADPAGFARVMWESWSPRGWFRPKTFEAVARSFANPDWVDVAIHSYRSRWGEVAPDRRSAWLDTAIRRNKRLATPTLFLYGTRDEVTPPALSANMHATHAALERVAIRGAGHFVQREQPDRVARHLVRHFLRNLT